MPWSLRLSIKEQRARIEELETHLRGIEESLSHIDGRTTRVETLKVVRKVVAEIGAILA